MPLVRFEVKNEYGLGDRELYMKEEQPRAILDGVSVAGLVGILRQLGDLAEFAADIFHDLHEQVMTTTARGRKMLSTIKHIESALPSLETAIQGQRNHIRFAYIAGCNWHSNVQIDQSQLLCRDLPQFMIDFYEECCDPPHLYLLDKFDSSGAGACLKRYSDPSYFKRALASSQAVKAEKIRRKKKKRGSWRNKGLRHVVSTYKDGNSAQNVSIFDTRSKSEPANYDSQTRTNCVEQVSEVANSHQSGSVDSQEDIVFELANPSLPGITISKCQTKQEIEFWTNGGILGVEPSKPPHFESSSSPPLAHMKISFRAVDCLETSTLKLDFCGGGDLVIPSFQLIQGPSTASESDDDTFCRSSVYSFDDLRSLNSESNSETWGGDERSESRKQRVSDNSSKASLLTTSICGVLQDHLEVERGKISDSSSDPDGECIISRFS